MPKFIIERNIPGVGQKTRADWQPVAAKSCAVLNEMGSQVQWQHSYITGDRMYCVYIASSEEAVREHARRGGFPADRVSRVTEIVDPTNSEQP